MNRFQKKRSPFHFLKSFLLPLIIFVAVLAFFLTGVRSVSVSAQAEEQTSLEKAIIRSAVHCYAVEGTYPESLAYLVEHYGISYDHTKYVVDYEIIGSNMMPSVTIIPLQNRKGASL